MLHVLLGIGRFTAITLSLLTNINGQIGGANRCLTTLSFETPIASASASASIVTITVHDHIMYTEVIKRPHPVTRFNIFFRIHFSYQRTQVLPCHVI